MSFNRTVEDKITKIMGSYLLKGYTLLDNHCPKCQTPLMKTKTSTEYCIYCNEINVQSVDNQMPNSSSSNGSNVSAMIKDNYKEEIESRTSVKRAVSPSDKTLDSANSNSSNNNNVETERQYVEKTVHQKMVWAVDRLKTCDQMSECLQILNFVKMSADLLLTLNKLNHTSNQ
ncbi:protein ZNRD2-like [Oppia nitens]|uniref:protein ZNRD2-like n=1 Tax=Oppia nitens TaxID=1686743 RepID=UPI0023DB3944|nr:protein ZNRD2-like [Oppia nitens]